MKSISKNVYVNKLNDIINKYNNTNHTTTKLMSVDVKSSTCIDFNIENDDTEPKLEVWVNLRISKYKKFFAKGYDSKLCD